MGIRQTKITTWTNQQIINRKEMRKFGKPAQNDAAAEKMLVIRSEEEIPIEVSKQKKFNVTVKDEDEDRFHEESIKIAASMNTKKKSWTEGRKRDDAGPEPPLTTQPPDPVPAQDGKDGPGKYLPPSIRLQQNQQNADGKGPGKGPGKFDGQENSLRISNLSEDVRQGDLEDLFSSVGRIARTFLAKDDNGASRGFAFITYYTRDDALKAIAKLNG